MFAKFQYFGVIGIFHLRKSSNQRDSVLVIYAPNFCEISWPPRGQGFMEVWNFWFHWPSISKMASHWLQWA